MKDYINVFHGIISEIHFWDEMNSDKKRDVLTRFLENFYNTEYLVDYFNNFNYDLNKYDLNSYLKSVNNQ
jgi:cytochrome b pre-mRNA-processing protein 3